MHEKNNSIKILCWMSVVMVACTLPVAARSEKVVVEVPKLSMDELDAALKNARNPFTVILPEKRPEPDPVIKPIQRVEPRFQQTPVQPVVQQPIRIVEPEPVRTRVPDLPAVIIPPELDLAGIVWNSERPQAIVNGQVVEVGDRIAGAEIIIINKTGLNVSFQGKTFTINLD